MRMPFKTLSPQEARRSAEERFSKITAAEQKAAKEREKAKLIEENKTAKLRALRLAKEAADKEAAEAAAAEKAAAKAAKPKRAKKPA